MLSKSVRPWFSLVQRQNLSFEAFSTSWSHWISVVCSIPRLLWFQIESKKAAAKNLESSVEEAKGRLATQLEEQSRLEDKIRALSIDLATEQAQVEKLHHDVSFL